MNRHVSKRSGATRGPRIGQARARGQALTEFVVAMLVVLPIFLGVYYLGKYADLHQSAVQGSRYAAFQRAIQPDESRLSTAEIEDKMRARFFLRSDALTSDGRLSSSDSVQRLSYRDGHVALWHDLAGNPLLKDHRQVSLAFQSESVDSLASHISSVADWTYGLKNRPIQKADVEVSFVDRLQPGAQMLKIGASTATLGDAWNAAGSNGVREAVSMTQEGNPAKKLVDGFMSVMQGISWVIGFFEDSGPTFPCVSVETVPLDRTSGGEQVQYGGCR